MKGQNMAWVTDLEKLLDDTLHKKAPISIPEHVRKLIAHILWVAALAIGVINLWNAIDIWTWGHDSGNSVVALYAPAVHLSMFYYLALWGTTAVGILALLAAPRLKEMQKSGWNYLYYVVLIEAVPVVLRLFSEAAGGPGSFVLWAVVTIAEAYVLFQVRDYFTGARVVAHHTAEPEHHEEPEEQPDEPAEAPDSSEPEPHDAPKPAHHKSKK